MDFNIVLEYASGGALSEYIGKDLSELVLVRLTTELADGLHYIHDHHVIHRDLKASNILLEGDDPA